jgi:hypothetical protein
MNQDCIGKCKLGVKESRVGAPRKGATLKKVNLHGFFVFRPLRTFPYLLSFRQTNSYIKHYNYRITSHNEKK